MVYLYYSKRQIREMNSTVIALKVEENDNVATIFSNDVKSDSVVDVLDKKGIKIPVVVLSDIPYGHKIALQMIGKGEKIIKYGEIIGQASRCIEKGDHVHVQNIESLRGRGDL